MLSRNLPCLQDRSWDFATVSRGTRACHSHWPQNEGKWNLQPVLLQWEQTCKFLSHSIKDFPQVICFKDGGGKTGGLGAGMLLT